MPHLYDACVCVGGGGVGRTFNSARSALLPPPEDSCHRPAVHVCGGQVGVAANP